MVYTYQEYRRRIADSIGAWSFWWEFLVAGAVFLVPWIIKSVRAGEPDVPELEDFAFATLTLLTMELIRRFAGRGRAAYELYREAAMRADSSEATAQTLKETRAEQNWHDVSGRFLTLKDYRINAHRTVFIENGAEREDWELDGESAPHRRSFKAVCELAGDTLTISKVWAKLPSQVTEEKDPFLRWLRYVAHVDGIRESGSTSKYADDGSLVTDSTTWSFDDLAMQSKRLCQDNLLHDRRVNP